MEKLYRIFLSALLCIALAAPSHADTSDLLKLLGDKTYWTDLKWDKFEDTELYRVAEWRPPGWPGRSGVTVTNCYTTKIVWADLGLGEMTVYEYSGAVTNFWDRKDLERVYATSGRQKTGEEYNKLVDWGNKRFGDPITKDEKTDFVSEDRVVNKLKTSWEVGATIVSVTTEETSIARKNEHFFLTLLSFDKKLPRREPEVDTRKD